jgi:hypothetical protein
VAPRPANGISRRLAAAGFQRHEPGAAGFRATGAGGGVMVTHLDRYGSVQPPGRDLQNYGEFLTALGYRVYVVDDEYLMVV